MINEPAANKMITGAPNKKEFHFAATTEHYAAVVYAETTEEAEKIYHQIKRRIGAIEPITVAPQPEQTAPLSTPTPAPKEESVE